MDMILASTSPYRRTLLERLGLPFRCLAPDVDEDALKRRWSGASPGDLAGLLAEAKAVSLAEPRPEALVIGGDQLVSFAGTILGKPGSAEQARRQLGAMAGRSHELITAIHVCHEGRSWAHADVTTLHVRALTALEIARYVEADRPLDCAGSYKLESRGITLFDRIESADQSAIIGLPLIALTTILRTIGLAIP